MTPLKRRFKNPTPGWVGATIINAKNEPQGVPVAPGDEIWLSEQEERLTAEAPRQPQDNPFVKSWEEIQYNEENIEIGRVTHEGCLVLVDSEARPIGSERFTPSSADATAQEPPAAAPPEEPPAPPAEEPPPEEAPPAEEGPPEPPAAEGKQAAGEIVGTPDAPRANAEELARRAEEEPRPVEGDRPQGAESIGIPRTRE